MSAEISNVLVIHTRDLRYLDNALYKIPGNITSCFIFTHEQIDDNTSYFSNPAFAFMLDSLKELEDDLKKHDIKLHYLHGPLKKTVVDLLDKNSFTDVVISKDYTAFAKHRESVINDICEKTDVKFHCVENHYLCMLSKDDKNVYKKYTPYNHKVLQYIKSNPDVTDILKYKTSASSTKLNSSYKVDIKDMYEILPEQKVDTIIGGRSHALEILRKAKSYSQYSTIRDDLSLETTHLSAYLKFGCVSIRETYHAFIAIKSFVNELIWRDFYAVILDSRPDLVDYKTEDNQPFNLHYRNIKWNDISKEPYKSQFKAWKTAKTGYPIIDAAITELRETGYMHNRCRMIVASFLTKVLMIDWREGERFFAQRLVDYDPASNNGGWQWCAGSGVDAQPYFRIFNPAEQHKKHDSKSEYVKKWLPHLKNKTHKEILQMYDSDKLIVDYKVGKAKVLAHYKKYISNSKSGGEPEEDVEDELKETQDAAETQTPLIQEVYETNKIRLLTFLEPYNIKEFDIVKCLETSDPYQYLKTKAKSSEWEIDRVQTRINQFRKNLEIKNISVQAYLDFGCNNGELSIAVGQGLGFDVSNIYGVDILTDTKITASNYHKATDHKLIPPFREHQFYLISSQMVLHHISHLELTLTELSKVIEKNGLFYLREHNITNENDAKFVDLVHILYNRSLPADSTEEFGEAPYTKYYSISEWTKMFEKHGFQRIHLNYRESVDRNPQNKFIAVFRKQ